MKYFTRSTVLFLMLYSMVAFTIGNLYGDGTMTLVTGSRIAIVVLLLQYLLGPSLISWLLDIDWTLEIPPRNRQFLDGLCRREELPMPRVGVINASVPNAFTFGRTRNDARVVVTTGLLETLTPEETDAVLAHEVGHIKHRDFLVITAAAMAPMLLFQIYLWARRLKEEHWGTWFAFATYWVSEMIVLSLSRTREYWADAFAAEATGNPSVLSSALVKIAYGISRTDREAAWARKHGNPHQKFEALGNAALLGRIGALGIAAPEVSLALKGPTAASAAKVMKWDLVNPWARVHQYLSTHPLTAMRVSALNRMGYKQGRSATFPLPQWPRIEWRRFPLEFPLWAAPWALAFTMVAVTGLAIRGMLQVPPYCLAVLAGCLFISWIARILYRYQGTFEPAQISSLIEDTVASNMRPRAVRIEGWVTGRGDPGLFWSPDLLIRDDSGTVFLLDRQSIPLARLFLIPDADSLIGQQVIVEGWYRRDPAPYVELSRAECPDEGIVHRSHSRWIQMVYAAAGSAALYWLTSTSL